MLDFSTVQWAVEKGAVTPQLLEYCVKVHYIWGIVTVAGLGIIGVVFAFCFGVESRKKKG